MPQRKIEIKGVDGYSALKADVSIFIKRWPDGSLSISDAERLALVQMAIQPPRDGKLHPYLAEWFSILFARHPDFTLAVLQHLRSKWFPKKENSTLAGKSWRIQKFILTHTYFAPIPDRPSKLQCVLRMTDGEIAQGYQLATDEVVSIQDVKHARKELAARIDREPTVVKRNKTTGTVSR